MWFPQEDRLSFQQTTEVQMIYSVVLVSGVHQGDSVLNIYIYISGYFAIYVIKEYWADFPVLYYRSLLVMYFIYSNV